MGKNRGKMKTTFFLVVNVFLSILIVILNKWLYVNTGFPNMTLSMLHFLVTFAGLVVCERFNVFCIKDAALRDMVAVAATFCGFVVLTNLSLARNTVGTYQIAKMLTTPCVIFFQIIFYRKKFGLAVKLTLLPIVLGVVVNFYYDLRFNVAGTFYAGAGVLVTSLYQVWINTKQREFQMDPMQLLYYQAPISAAMLLFLVPVFEPIKETLQHEWTLLDAAMIVLSSIVAFFVNLTSYWIIGYTSPLTYNMVGHCKFCLLLLGGSLVFHESLAINQAIGITLTLVGVILYAHVKMRDNKTTSLESGAAEAKSTSYKI